MAEAIVNTARGTTNINTDRIVVDMSDKISLLKPREYPLTVLLSKISKRTTHNYKFEWLEDDLMAVWVSADGAKVAGDTAVTLQSSEGALVAVGDLLKIVLTGEIVKVSAVATDVLTITRAYGTTSAGDITDGGKILVLGNANMQGSGAPSEKASNTSTVFNYTQIIKTPFSITNTLDAMKLYGGSEYNRIANRKGIEHGRSIEQSIIFGEKKLDLTGAQPLSTTAGVITFLGGTDNVVTVAKADFDLDALFDFCEKVFTYGSGTKTWLMSATIMTLVNKVAADYLNIIQSDMDKTLGLNVTEFVSPHGTLKMVQHPLFVQGYAGYSAVLDLEELSVRVLTGRDTKLKTNIQTNEEDGRRDQYLTESGLELKQPKKHGMLIVTL